MKKCMLCGMENKDENKYCEACGGTQFEVASMKENGIGQDTMPSNLPQLAPVPQVAYSRNVNLNQPVRPVYNTQNKNGNSDKREVSNNKDTPKRKGSVIKNLGALFSAILCSLLIFGVPVVAGDRGVTATLKEMCEEVREFGGLGGMLGDDFDFAVYLSGLLFWIVIGVAIVMAISVFVKHKAVKIIRTLIVIAMVASVGCFHYVLAELIDAKVFGSAYELLFIGTTVMAIVACFTDKQENYAVYDNDDDGESWRCPKCDVRNIGSMCKVCGRSRYDR